MQNGSRIQHYFEMCKIRFYFVLIVLGAIYLNVIVDKYFRHEPIRLTIEIFLVQKFPIISSSMTAMLAANHTQINRKVVK